MITFSTEPIQQFTWIAVEDFPLIVIAIHIMLGSPVFLRIQKVQLFTKTMSSWILLI